jgi:putative transposase
MLQIQQDNCVINKSFYLALGVDTKGQKELMVIWINENEPARNNTFY